MTTEEVLKIKKERLNKLDNSPKNEKAPGVKRKLARQVRNLEKTVTTTE